MYEATAKAFGLTRQAVYNWGTRGIPVLAARRLRGIRPAGADDRAEIDPDRQFAVVSRARLRTQDAPWRITRPTSPPGLSGLWVAEVPGPRDPAAGYGGGGHGG